MNSSKRKDLELGNYKDESGNLTPCKNFFIGQATDQKPIIKIKN